MELANTSYLEHEEEAQFNSLVRSVGVPNSSWDKLQHPHDPHKGSYSDDVEVSHSSNMACVGQKAALSLI